MTLRYRMPLHLLRAKLAGRLLFQWELEAHRNGWEWNPVTGSWEKWRAGDGLV